MSRFGFAAILALVLGTAPLVASAVPHNLDYTGPVDQAVFLEAGVYHLTPFGTADGYDYDAINVWGRTTGCDGNGENCDQGWRWRLNIWDSPGATGTSILSFQTSLFSTAGAALSAAQTLGPLEFTIASSETLYFFFTDSNFGDNIGGISFDLTRVGAASIPAPATLALLATGFVGLLWSYRRRQNA